MHTPSVAASHASSFLPPASSSSFSFFCVGAVDVLSFSLKQILPLPSSLNYTTLASSLLTTNQISSQLWLELNSAPGTVPFFKAKGRFNMSQLWGRTPNTKDEHLPHIMRFMTAVLQNTSWKGCNSTLGEKKHHNTHENNYFWCSISHWGRAGA